MVSTLSIWARIPNHTYHKNIHFENALNIGIFMNSEKYTQNMHIYTLYSDENTNIHNKRI